MSRDIGSKLASFVEKLPEFVAFACVSVLLVDDLGSYLLGHKSAFDLPKRLDLVAATLAALAVSFHLSRRTMSKMLVSQTRDHLGVEELIPSSTQLELEGVFRRSKTIRILSLAGTKLARLGDQTILEELGTPGRNKHIMILLGDPFSSAVKARYEQDEPPTYETGIAGLGRRLRTLHALRESMTAPQRANFEVRVFTSYPTCSIIQCDDDLFSATYAYQMRGAECPKIHSKVGGRYAQFLLTHFQKVYDNSIPLEDWVANHPPASKV